MQSLESFLRRFHEIFFLFQEKSTFLQEFLLVFFSVLHVNMFVTIGIPGINYAGPFRAR